MPRALSSKAIYSILTFSIGTCILGFIFWSFDIDPMWAVISFVLVFDTDVRTAMAAGLSRLGFTIFGSALAMIAVFLFGLHKWLLPVSLAGAALICGFLLRSRGALRIVLVTVALIIGSSLLQPSSGPYIAVTRSIEVIVGSLLAIAFSWLVAWHSSRRRGALRSGDL